MYPIEPIPSLSSTSETYIPIVKSESDGNYPKVRRKTTRGREKFSLIYSGITHTEFTILQDFFKLNQGLVFEFTEPLTGVVRNCIFSQESLEKKYDTVNTVSTSVQLEEV